MGFNIMDLQRGRTATAKSKADEGRNVLKYIDVDDLVPSEDNFYSMSAIDELAALIEVAGGVKQPGLVTPLGGGKYRVIAGHRRRLASIALVKQGKEQYRKMPCMVEDPAAEPGEDADELRTIDEAILLIATNGQREKTDWDKVQEVTRLRELLERKRRFEKIPGETRKIIAEQLGTTPAQVGRYDSIAKHLIPEFVEKLKRGVVNISVAYELSTMTEPEQREALALGNVRNGLSIDDVKRLREELRKPNQEAEPPERDNAEIPTSAAQTPPEPPAGKVVDFHPAPPSEPVQERETPPERMNEKRAALVLEDLVTYCEEMTGADGVKPETWIEYADALTVAIGKLRGR